MTEFVARCVSPAVVALVPVDCGPGVGWPIQVCLPYIDMLHISALIGELSRLQPMITLNPILQELVNLQGIVIRNRLSSDLNLPKIKIGSPVGMNSCFWLPVHRVLVLEANLSLVIDGREKVSLFENVGLLARVPPGLVGPHCSTTHLIAQLQFSCCSFFLV